MDEYECEDCGKPHLSISAMMACPCNRFGPGQAIQWWEKQAFGAQPAATAERAISERQACQ